MSTFKKKLSKLILAVAGLASGLFVLLDLTGAEQAPAEASVLVELHDAGFLKEGNDQIGWEEITANPNSLISAFFAPETGTGLTVVWTQTHYENVIKGDNKTYLKFTTLKEHRASDDKWDYAKRIYSEGGNQIYSTYGVQAVLLDKVNALCLFYRQPEGQYKAQMKYGCRQDTNDKYDDLNGWLSVTANLNPGWNLNEVSSMVSVTPSTLSTNKFLAAASNYTNGSWNIKDMQCEVTASSLNCGAGGPPIIEQRGLDPSIIALPVDENNEIRVLFYRGDKDEVYYKIVGGDINTTSIRLLTTSNNTAVTDKLQSAYHFNGNVYMTWSNKNDRVYLSKIPVNNLLLDTDYGYKKWTLLLQNVDIRSDGPPNIFEYNDKLYILYSDKNNRHRVSYYKIDNR